MIASLVSLTIRLTLFFPIRNKYDNETCESLDAKNRIVNMSRSAAGVAFLGFVYFFWINGPTRLNKCSNLSGDIRKKLKIFLYLIILTVKKKWLSKRIYNLDLIANFSFFNKTWETWQFVSNKQRAGKESEVNFRNK